MKALNHVGTERPLEQSLNWGVMRSLREKWRWKLAADENNEVATGPVFFVIPGRPGCCIRSGENLQPSCGERTMCVQGIISAPHPPSRGHTAL